MDSDDDDAKTWLGYTRDVAPLDKANIEPSAHDASKKKQSFSHEKAGQQNFLAKTLRVLKAPRPYQLDGSTDDKLRRGKLPLEARLDLHGMTRDQARAALENFVFQSQSQDRRCVLVITGKGKNSPQEERDWWEGKQKTLRACFSDWISEDPLRSLVIKSYSAQPEHGGSGAFYLYLRRLK